MKLKFILPVFIFLSVRLIVIDQEVQDSVMYISYISREERDREAYENRSRDGDFYWLHLAIRYAKEVEGERVLAFTGETQLITIPRSSIDTTAIIDWTKSKMWTPEYGRELLEDPENKAFLFYQQGTTNRPRQIYFDPGCVLATCILLKEV